MTQNIIKQIEHKIKERKGKQQIHQQSCKYKYRNAYTQQLSKQQIITMIVFLIQLIMHQIFISPQCPDLNQAILWTMFGFRYGLLTIVIYDYIILTINDPVDRLIIDQKRRYKHKQYQLRYCNICQSNVQRNSHHCMTCNRCTQNFDHHCKYLNNCIGVNNYQNFIRLLITYISFIFIGTGMGIWILVVNQQTQQQILDKQSARKWIIIAYIIYSFILSVFVIVLLSFHLYISCCANMTTKQYIYQDKDKQLMSKQNNFKIRIQPAPLTAEVFNLKSNQKKKNYQSNQQSQQSNKQYKQKNKLSPKQQNQEEDQKKVPPTNHTQTFYQPMEYYRK